MSMLRALQTLLAFEAGEISPAQLDALLSEPGRYSEWQVLCSMQKQAARMLDSDTLDKTLKSRLALQALCTSPHGYFYSLSNLARIAPSAWAAYLPEDRYISNSNGFATSWINAIDPEIRNFGQTNTSARPIFDKGASIVPGLPSLRFESDDSLLNSVGFNQPTSYALFFVYRRNDANSSVLLGCNTAPTTAQSLAASGSSQPYVSATSSNATGQFTNTLSPAVGEWGMSRFRRTSASVLHHSLNGGDESDPFIPSAAIPAFSSTPMGFGYGWPDTGSFNMAEVWMLASPPESDIQRVTSMLKAKYGL